MSFLIPLECMSMFNLHQESTRTKEEMTEVTTTTYHKQDNSDKINVTNLRNKATMTRQGSSSLSHQT